MCREAGRRVLCCTPREGTRPPQSMIGKLGKEEMKSALEELRFIVSLDFDLRHWVDSTA